MSSNEEEAGPRWDAPGSLAEAASVWNGLLPDEIVGGSSMRRALEVMGALPGDLSICPHGFEVRLGPSPKVGATIGFPFDHRMAWRFHTPLRVAEAMRDLVAASPLSELLQAVLHRIDAGAWATTDHTSDPPRPRIIYTALDGQDPLQVVGVNMIFFSARHGAHVRRKQWDWLLGEWRSPPMIDTIRAIERAHEDTAVHQLGLTLKPTGPVLKVYPYARFRDHLSAMREWYGALPIDDALLQLFEELPNAKGVRVEDWAGGQRVRMGMEINLEGAARPRAAMCQILRRAPEFASFGEPLWRLIGGHEGEHPWGGGAVVRYKNTHVKVSVSATPEAGPEAEWKMYLLQRVELRGSSAEERLAGSLRNLFGSSA